MKIAVTSKGNDLSAEVDPRFGRCDTFVVVDPDSMAFEAVANSNTNAAGGAGIQSAQLMAEHDAKVVLTGNCGPNAFRTLEAAGITVITGVSGTVGEAILSYQNGALTATDAPNVGSHFGTAGV